jgi:hypothetical protein
VADDLPDRLERIRAFYLPLGIGHLAVVKPADNLIVGQIADHETSLSPETGILRWGERLPPGLESGPGIAAAPLPELQAIVGTTAAFAWHDSRLVVVNAAAGPATIYRADSASATVVATHAVAGALLAAVPLEIDPAAVAEFVAMDFTGGDRTILREVSAIAPATRMALSADGVRCETYWPAGDRWELVTEPDAYAAAETELMESIGQRTRGSRVGLALTAGLDSTVAATALAEAGVSATAFTWGGKGWADSTGAATTAQRFGFEHTVTGFEPLSSAECLADLDRDARWTDGVTALATVRRAWPDGVDAVVVGMGGESGRAFYYDAWSALFVPRPSTERLVRQLGAYGRLRAADEGARAALSRSVRRWVEDARATGVRGWRVLDVLYSEQRVRRWGRSQLPRLGADVIPVFTPPRLARALVSLSLEERLMDGFHRRFLAARGVEPASSPAEIPSFSALSWFARRRLLGFRRRRPQPYDDPVDLLVASAWGDKSDVAEWLRTEVLTHPAITDSLGRAWGDATWEAFRAGRIRSTERLMRAAGVVALATALPRRTE